MSSSTTLQPTSGNLFKYDGPAGTVVFLVALPLCLGIALASGAPLFAGIISGIVGGLLVSLLSGSQLSVSGPAAGLTTIVSAAIVDFGNFQVFQMAVVAAGAMQIGLGMLRAGVVGDYVPHAVIKGMLAGIGWVIILKQIPHALGRDKDYEGDFGFFETGSSNTITDILEAIVTMSPGAALIAGISLALIVGWEWRASKGSKFFKIVPAPLIAVGTSVMLNEAFRMFAPGIHVSAQEHMVSLPVISSAHEFASQFTLPDWGQLTNPKIWKVGFVIAIVGSIESLLSLEAADKLDPYRRISPPNRELLAQGMGNTVSGLIGGLPLTSVVVRTSANIYAGGRTRMACFTHGALLLIAVVAIPGLLNRIPLACLASILILVGYKLTKLDIYREQYRAGWAQFLPFIFTVAAIVFTDLLTGVMLGLAFGLFFVIRSNHHAAITLVHQERFYLIRFNKDATFVNKSDLKTKLRSIPPGSHLFIDGTRAFYMDHDIYEVLHDFEKLAPYEGITLEYRNIDDPHRK
ncbi:MAG: SulP family inorganic anion transporter [Bryobacterales bacterium]|nr:SulP family inorganic anion transporter [Bryobacterales bacterium]